MFFSILLNLALEFNYDLNNLPKKLSLFLKTVKLINSSVVFYFISKSFQTDK